MKIILIASVLLLSLALAPAFAQGGAGGSQSVSAARYADGDALEVGARNA